MNSIKQTELNPSNTQTLTKACLASCRKLIAQVEVRQPPDLVDIHDHAPSLATNLV